MDGSTAHRHVRLVLTTGDGPGSCDASHGHICMPCCVEVIRVVAKAHMAGEFAAVLPGALAAAGCEPRLCRETALFVLRCGLALVYSKQEGTQN